MHFRLKTNSLSVLAASFVLAAVFCVPARGQGLNVVTDPTFAGQSPNFQTDGQISPDWSYTPDYLYAGGAPLTLVSQTISTPGNLYIYDIDVTFTTAPTMDFFVYWDGSLVSLITGASGWDNYNILETAVGPTSEIGFVGSPEAWGALGSVDVSWTGEVDPVPDSPLGFGWEAGTLAGLCAVAGLGRRQDLRPGRAG